MALEGTKIAAAVLTAGIVTMGSGFIAEVLFHRAPLEEPAYSVAPTEAEGEVETPKEDKIESVLPLMASADAAAGEAEARKCVACHSFEQGGPNKVGPNLWNVVNAQVAHLDDYAYSDALQVLHDNTTWTYGNLNGFLHKPADWAPGTKMSYAGLSKVQDRANMIAYLRSLSDSPAPLPTEAEIAAETGSGGEGDAAAGDSGATEAAPASDESGEAAPGDQGAAGGDETQAAAAETQSDAGASGTASAEAPAEETTEPASGTSETGEAGGGAASEASSGEAAAADEPTEPAQAEEAAEPAATADAPAEEPTEPASGTSETDETGEAGGGAAAEASGDTQQAAAPAGGDVFAALVAAASVDDGKKVSRKCAACHSFEQGGPNKVGPNLWNVVDAPIAKVEGFNFSDALSAMSDKKWTYDNLDAYLKNPKEFAPGNRMSFAGLRKEDDRAAMVAYLRSLSDSPAPLPGN